jgi:chromosomal replication initiator protein
VDNYVEILKRRSEMMSEHEDVWTAVAQLLRAQLTESVWYSTFQDVVPLSWDAETLLIQVPSTLARDRILNRYLPILTEAMEEMGFPHREVQVEIAHAEAGSKNQAHRSH